MAILSISRLQQRRGLSSDLPANLYEAEFGWCLDTRQLFIGNGNTFTGNSQVLTQWSPNDQIITHAYQGDTGINATGTVPRQLGSILDDTLCVKDYGAVGDGLTDDTAAIQRAISDEWARIAESPATALSSRNIIYFPAGTYLVSQSILLYPFITLQGEGISHTEIRLMAGSTGPVFRTADSLGQTDASIGTNGAVLPEAITLRYMTINGSADYTTDVVLLQRCNNVSLQYCDIVGAYNIGDNPNTYKGGVNIQSLGNAVVTSDITVENSTIQHVSYGLACGDPVQRIFVTQSQLRNCHYGINLTGGNNGPSFVQANLCEFKNISSHGIRVETYNTGVASLGNFYNDCGSNINNNAALYWSVNSNGCTSVGDIFSNLYRNGRIRNGNPAQSLVLDAQQTEICINQPTPLLFSLEPNQINYGSNAVWSVLDITSLLTVQIQYTITMGTYVRTGQMQIITDGHTAKLTDTSTDLHADASVVWSVGLVGTDLQLFYTTSGTASTGIMKYIYTTWQY